AQVLGPREVHQRLAKTPPAVLPSACCESVGTSTAPISGLDSPAYAYPYRRFADALTDANARLGATVDRYSLDVELSHLLLHAGLSRRRHNI
ncbi:MAG: hypothetical protein ACRDVM_03130, partial [Acidimicrobiia bacterium]